MPGAVFTEATDIRDDGTIGGAYFDSVGTLRAYVRAPGGALTLLPMLPGAGAMNGVALNDSGLMIGNIADDPFAPTEVLAYILHDFAFVSTFGIPGSFLTQATGINNAGTIVGYSQTSFVAPPQSFIRAADGTLTSFSVPGSLGSQLYDINNNGDLSGTYLDTMGRQRGFISRNGIVTTLDYSNLDTIIARLNDNGQAVGFAFSSGTLFSGPYEGFVVTPVPEPGSMTLGAAGLAFILFRAVRQPQMKRNKSI